MFPEGCVPLQDVDCLAGRIAAAMDGDIMAPQAGNQFSLAAMQQAELSLYDELTAAPSKRQAA